MEQSNLLLKRPWILCVFLIFACSEQKSTLESEPNLTQTDVNVSSNLGSSSVEPVTALLTLQELLGAYDVKQALAKAAKAEDMQDLKLWQQTLLDAAREVNLASTEMAMIDGAQGLQYLKFQGMKTNYQIAFEQAFLEFGNVGKVYADFPAFENLHKRSMSLVKQRDELVAKVSAQLNEGGFKGNTLTEAKRQWQEFFKAQSALQQSKERLTP
jgi:hypothetical protein